MNFLTAIQKGIKTTGQAQLSGYVRDFDKWAGISTNRGIGSDDASELGVYSGGAAAWISICLNRKMMDVSNAEYYFADLDGERIDTVDPQISDALEAGFAGLTFNDLIALACGHEDLTGNALWIKNTGKSRWTQMQKITGEFIPIPPGRFKIKTTAKGLSIDYYQVDWPDGTQERYAPEEVIHYKRNPLMSPLVGIGLIAQGRMTVESDKVALEYQNQFFQDKGTPDMVLIRKDQRNPEAAQRDKEFYTESYAAGKFKNGLLYAFGDTEIKPISVSANDLQFVESRNFNQQQVISLMESLGTVIGLPDANNRASAGVLKNAYFGIVNSRIKHLLGAFTRQFVWPISHDIKLTFTPYPTGDINDEILAVQYGLTTLADASKRLGKPYDETDDQQITRYITRNLQPLEQAINPPSFGQGFAATVVNQKKKANSWIELSHKQLWTFDRATKRNSVGALPWQMKLLELATRSKEKTFKKYRPVIDDFFGLQAERIDNRIDELFRSKAADDIVNPAQAAALIDVIFPQGLEDDLLRQATTPMHTSGVQKAVEDLNTVSSRPVVASLTNPKVVLAIDELGRRITRVNEATKAAVSRIIQDGATQGQTVATVANNVKTIVKETYANRGLTIARTETRLAYSGGTEAAFRELDVEKFDVVGCVGTLAGTNELGLSASYGDRSEEVGSCGVENVDIKLLEHVAMLHHPNHNGTEVPRLEP